MDEKLTSPNLAAATDQAPGLKPEDLQAGPAGSEVVPEPGSAPSSQGPTAQPPPKAKMSAADVTAAISATAPPANPIAGMVPTPSIAGDVDVIEPEWVNKAETVIAEHTGDPYGEENAIEDLQQDYLKKRYNYDIANPNADTSKPERT